MLTLVANTTRSHGGVEMRFLDKAPSTPNTDTRSTVTAAEHLDIPNRVQHWFRGGHVCRLCNAMHVKPKEHFQSGVEARHHVIKEIFLSYWLEEDKKGYKFSGTKFWEQRLQRKRMEGKEFFRMKEDMMQNCLKDYRPLILASSSDSSSSSSLPKRRKKNLQDRGLFLYCVLHFLKENHVLGPSLSPARPSPSERKSYSLDPKNRENKTVGIGRTYTKAVRNTVRFESLEYTGDSLWGFEASARLLWLMPNRDWLCYSHAWAAGILRDGVESNENLMKLAELLFDLKEEYDFDHLPYNKRLRRIDHMLPSDVILGGGKAMADILESSMGELHAKLMELTSSPEGVCKNYPTGHLYFNGLNPSNSPDQILATLIRFAIDEMNDLATLVFGYSHVGYDAETRLVPFMKELVHTSVKMKPPDQANTAFSFEKRQRTSNTFFKGRRLKGTAMNVMSGNNNHSSNNNSSKASSLPASVLDALYAQEFTFVDHKLQKEKTTIEVEDKKIDRSNDFLTKTSFNNSSNGNNNKSKDEIGSYSQSRISPKSFDRAIQNLLDQYPGENSFGLQQQQRSIARFSEEQEDDNNDEHQQPLSLQEKLRQHTTSDISKYYDRTRVETFAVTNALPRLTLEKREKVNDDDDVETVAANNNDENSTTFGDIEDTAMTNVSTLLDPLEFAKFHQPRAEGGGAASSLHESGLGKYEPVDESRVFPVHQPFEVDTGFIPQIVLDTEAKRSALVEKRKKMRRMRRI